MIKIGVISDTHISRIDREAELLIETLSDFFRDCQLLIHAGDIVSSAFLEELEKIAPVEAVKGNMDLPEIAGKLPEKKLIEVAGRIIGITHGGGPPNGIRKRIQVGFELKPDIIVYGHTHEAFKGYEDGIFFFNPGSPNDTRFTSRNSVGIITIDKRMIDAKILRFNWDEIVFKR